MTEKKRPGQPSVRPSARKTAQRAGAAAPPESRKGKRRGIMDRLVVLSSAAIVSVYSIGYIHTVAAENQISAQEASPAPAPEVSRRSAPETERRPSRTALPTPTPPGRGQAQPQTQPQTQTQTTAYRDGMYKGLGTSRHGNIEATVVIKNGKITSASISSCMTRYPCSDVNALVQEVVSRQSVPVDHVSRATDSSNAYKQAVTQALAGAK